MQTVTIHEAETHLSRLLRKGEAGEEILVLRGRAPVARIVPVEAAPRRDPSALRGLTILLDTQCWLSMEADPERFVPRARELLLDPASLLYLSAAGAWEISIKVAIGKLRLPSPPPAYVPGRMRRERIDPLFV